MSNIIIPSNIDEESVRIPMQFPLKAEADSVTDAGGRIVLKVSDAIAPSEAIKFAKLFAQAPTMFETLGDAYGIILAVAKNSGDDPHGSDGEDKLNCILCRMETILEAVK